VPQAEQANPVFSTGIMENYKILTIMNTTQARVVSSFDKVRITFSETGQGKTALLFVHGGLANRHFWVHQLAALSDRYHAIAVDLAGHGDSGRNRKTWTVDAFGKDIRAVADALALRQIVLIGNSLGGPVALSSARLLEGRVIGVVGVDTFQDAAQKMTSEEARGQADMYRNDFENTCKAMSERLFHPGRQTKLRNWAEAQMLMMPPEVVIGIMEGLAGYDMAERFGAVKVPIRAINGDLFPTNTELNRSIHPDFDVLIMKGAGHYPMLERPEEFNEYLREIVKQLEAATG
jgi:pimeloyl-ACP methyl ester carboxylesterase